jgi:glycosyltransferase involved in cell wall biosynthesis|tara:strand:+ start:439 stop:1110 length:672 start_codon:yes stop_codon:yes gene_type:complete
MSDDTLVVILTYNEQDKIINVLEEVSKSFKNVLVVDNNSEDLTVERVKKFPVFLVKHIYNLGKSDSMKTAMEFAKLQQFKYIAYIDGDGQHKSKDLINICKKIHNSKSQIVIGYRKELSNLNFQKKIGTIILQNLFAVIYKKKIYDIQSGLRVIDLSIESKIYWHSTGIMHYFADAEITCNAVKNKCVIEQIPIETLSSEKYKGMNILQGLYLILMILYWRFF